jgi:hypothetical protein
MGNIVTGVWKQFGWYVVGAIAFGVVALVALGIYG